MGYYDNDENVKEYVEMAEGYDGRALIEVGDLLSVRSAGIVKSQLCG